MKKKLLSLMVIPLIAIGGLSYAENELIVHDAENGTITVYTGDKSYGITIQDKNLGAENVGDYGYYFQWGNNHGNREHSGSFMGLISWDDSYENHGYDGEVTNYIEIWDGTYISINRDYWMETSGGDANTVYLNRTGNNLWGGGNDADNSNPDIIKGYDKIKHQATNYTGRKGPCDTGYHVPSAGEWQELVRLYANAVEYDLGSWDSNLVYFGNSGGMGFSNDLKLPLQGYLTCGDCNATDRGHYGFYWSSTPHDKRGLNNAWSLIFGQPNYDWGETNLRYLGNNIRCFKNEYVKPPVNKDIVIEATATESEQTLKINKYFNNSYTIDWGDGTTGDLTANTGHTYGVASGYIITLSLSGADRWTFKGTNDALVPQNGTTMTGVKIVSMPSLADGFGNSATNPGNNFFRSFNNNGALTSLPDGSFDTSNITTVGDYFFRAFNFYGRLTSLPDDSFNISNISGSAKLRFFANFNRNGALTSLPDGSFDTRNITTVGNNFFWEFNASGSLESLPENSFNISNISGSIGNEFFRCFNYYGQLASLPTGSFNISNISGSVGAQFFYCFNCGGLLTSLPEGSFDTSHITTVGNGFFEAFNSSGLLTSLPEGSFDTSHITTVGNGFFGSFNSRGPLTSLPTGSFNISNISGSVGNEFFQSFNGRGQLTSLPEGSFDTSHITTIGSSFFSNFNLSGGITSLPANSFNISNVTTVGDNAFRYFNGKEGALESLPDGSFDTSNIVSAGTGFSYYFNGNGGKITTLPNSFTLSSIGASKDYGYQNAFDSTGYTLNKKVSDLVEGITEPSTDMDTFSDNQPGRCGVHENWLVNPETACNILYDANGGEGTITGGYNTYTTGVAAGSGIVEPTRTGYILSGWIDASGNNVEEVIFPDMDGQTLYANWEAVIYTITIDVDGAITTITGEYGSPVTPPANPTKNGYTFKGWEPEIPATMPAEDLDIKATWDRNGSSGGGGGGGGGGGSSSSNTGSATSQTGSQIDSNTGSIASGTTVKEPEGTGDSTEIQTGSQVDPQPDEEISEQLPQNVDKDIQDSTANASEGQQYSEEFQQAYEFAKGRGITTMPTIQKANMNSPLTRIAMAKMLSQYAMNVLGKKPANTVVPKFNDVTDKQDSDYDYGITLAYQLGIMGQNMPNNNFRPTDEVTRAEFATALSRMLYNTSDGEYKSTSKYYTHHMEKLKEEGIITKDDPAMKELRGYVMIMLMRSAK